MSVPLVRLDEVADIPRGPISPQRYPSEPFALHSIPAYSSKSPEVVPGCDIKSNKTVVEAGDVLISKLNPRIPRVWLVEGRPEHRCICSTEFIPFRVRDNSLLDSEFLSLMMLAPQFIDDLQRMVRSSTGSHARVRPDDICARQVPLPRVDEQRRIVNRIKDCLCRVEEIERLRHDAVKEAEYLASSLYAAIVNEDEWPCMPVGGVVTRSRNGKSIRQDNENATGFVLSLSAVHDVSLDFSAKKPIVLRDVFAKQYRICDGDVFVSRSNTRELVGLSSVAVDTPDAPIIYPDLLIKLEADSTQILPRYLAYVLRTQESRRQIKDRSVGTSQSMVKISGERLKEVSISVPPLDVQESLIKRFDELHDLTAQLLGEMKSPEQERLRESILRKAFAGEL